MVMMVEYSVGAIGQLSHGRRGEVCVGAADQGPVTRRLTPVLLRRRRLRLWPHWASNDACRTVSLRATVSHCGLHETTADIEYPIAS